MVHSDSENSRIYQGSRQAIFSWMEPGPGQISTEQTNQVIFQLNYVRNHGAAWGSFSSLKDSIRLPLFHILTLAFCSFFLGVALTNTAKLSGAARFGIVIMVSGAGGNLIDRVWRGYVIDLFDLRWQLWDWRYALPVFNLADLFVIIGLFMLTITVLRR